MVERLLAKEKVARSSRVARSMRYLFIVIILGILVGGLAIVFSPESNNNQAIPKESPAMSPQSSPAESSNLQFKSAEQVLKKGKKYQATLKTDDGDIVIDLAADKTPITVNNFVFLAEKKFYDGVIFHRTIPGFMIQGGDPTGTGMGGPGYKFADEKFDGDYTRGTLAMANAGPNTNGSQFFIMHADYALPKNYVIFGHVASGLDVIDKIATAKTKSGGEGSSPVNPVHIQSVTINEHD